MFGVAVAACVGLGLGALIGAAGERRYWVAKGEAEGKTAVCADGRFYYVVPEAEYCELSRLRYTSRPAAPEGD